MARTKQTARKSTGGMAPRKFLAKAKNMKIEEKQKVDVSYDVSYESSFYAHYFASSTTNKIFEPHLGVAKTLNPFDAAKTEYWMSCNFNSKYDVQKTSIQRPVLKLVIVLDISGSMGSFFQDEDSKSQLQLTKLEVAKSALFSILTQLNDQDYFGLVVFDDRTEIIQNLSKLDSVDRKKLEQSINQLLPRGGTNLGPAIHSGTELFQNTPEIKDASSRIFFLTDMEADASSFLKSVKKNSDENLFTTVVGIGMDLANDVIQKVSETPGCNYANVRSTEGFKDLMTNEFGFLVTPIAFNIEIQASSQESSDKISFLKGFGSPELNKLNKQNNSFTLSTEFPSISNEKAEKRGGVMLFSLENQNQNKKNFSFSISVKHDNLSGIRESFDKTLEIKNEDPTQQYFENNSIRKAILLVHYTDFAKSVIEERKKRGETTTTTKKPKTTPKARKTKNSKAIEEKEEKKADETLSLKEKIEKFIKHFEEEMKIVCDETLKDELEFLNTLLVLEGGNSKLLDNIENKSDTTDIKIDSNNDNNDDNNDNNDDDDENNNNDDDDENNNNDDDEDDVPQYTTNSKKRKRSGKTKSNVKKLKN